MKHAKHFVPDKPIFACERNGEKKMGKSQTERAVREREKRAFKAKERQFNNPLRVFIEHKYPEIFREYTELFAAMKRRNPNRKNLLKTQIFREWKMTTAPVPAVMPQTEDILSQTIRETINNDPLLVEQPAPPPQQGPQDIRERIDDILNEMFLDEDLGAILQEPNTTEDEGIELNIEDELFHHIEPFDYQLDIEPNEF